MKRGLFFIALILIGSLLLVNISFVSAESYSCLGTATNCSDYNLKDSCRNQDGCSWHPWGSYCDGTADPCSEFTNEYYCENQGGCYWACVPDPGEECASLECGINACGQNCGTCDVGSKCENHDCVVCVNQCAGRECGPDGCGGTCGSPCVGNEACVDGQCEGPDDIILILSSATNAHAENYVQDSGYSVIISHPDIFGWTSGADNPHIIGGTIVKLSDATNAHARIPENVCYDFPDTCISVEDKTQCDDMQGCTWVINYGGLQQFCVDDCAAYDDNQEVCEGDDRCVWDEGDDLCYADDEDIILPCQDMETETECGNQIGCNWTVIPAYPYSVKYDGMDCRAKHITEGGCDRPGEQCIIKLSDWSNAHLETCDQGNYPIQICCTSEVDCTQFSTQYNCMNTMPGVCAWTPPLEAVGGCCPYGKEWKDGSCSSTQVTTCGPAWTSSTASAIAAGDDDASNYIDYIDGEYKYCAQVAEGIANNGYWTSIYKY